MFLVLLMILVVRLGFTSCMKNQRLLPCLEDIRLALKRKQMLTLNV
jgi:hypothetical protein